MIKTTSVSSEIFFEKALKKVILNTDRKDKLTAISNYIVKEYSKTGLVNLNFICTHNSRRSQISQVWSYFAADYFGLNIKSFSGGTEVTAFNRNSVKSLQKSGFSFQLIDFSHQNPSYEITYSGAKKPILGFSKLYDNAMNAKPFIAITTCNSADSNCPYIPEALHRFHLPFVDPKFSDGTEKQEEVYLKTNFQIAGEIHFLFASIEKELS